MPAAHSQRRPSACAGLERCGAHILASLSWPRTSRHPPSGPKSAGGTPAPSRLRRPPGLRVRTASGKTSAALSTPTNLVASCAECNQRRGATPSPKGGLGITEAT